MQPDPLSSSLVERRVRTVAWSLVPIVLIALVVWCGVSRYVTRLPRERPADFMVRYEILSGGTRQFDERFEIGLNHCVYVYHDLDDTSRSRDEVCQVSAAEIDQLYQLVRQNHFDRIRYDYIVVPFPCLPHGGGGILTVIADRQTYQTGPPPTCTLLFTGEQEWRAVYREVQDLKWRTVGQ